MLRERPLIMGWMMLKKITNCLLNEAWGYVITQERGYGFF